MLRKIKIIALTLPVKLQNNFFFLLCTSDWFSAKGKCMKLYNLSYYYFWCQRNDTKMTLKC